MAKKKYYAVAVGRKPGVYAQWYGQDGAEAQVNGYPGAIFKGFATLAEAKVFLRDHSTPLSQPASLKSKTAKNPEKAPPKAEPQGRAVIYTDGGAINNPGPGGYGVVVIEGGRRKELSRGFRHTTNNRMELMACIAGLKAVSKPSAITLYSDSKYVVNGITKGWAKRWQKNNWMRTRTEPAINPDLWAELLELCDFHQVQFRWVKGHAGNPENERCDRLAVAAARGGKRLIDKGYEKSLL